MAAAARGREPDRTGAIQGPDFSDFLRNSIQQVNSVQGSAAEVARAFELGDPNTSLADVMLSMQKANIAFQALTQVRNKLVAAYQEVMNMQM